MDYCLKKKETSMPGNRMIGMKGRERSNAWMKDFLRPKLVLFGRNIFSICIVYLEVKLEWKSLRMVKQEVRMRYDVSGELMINSRVKESFVKQKNQ